MQVRYTQPAGGGVTSLMYVGDAALDQTLGPSKLQWAALALLAGWLLLRSRRA
jgi:hypothetical protein